VIKDIELWRVSADGVNVCITKSPPGILRGGDQIADVATEEIAHFIVRAVKFYDAAVREAPADLLLRATGRAVAALRGKP
jgi:hypothetical protein